MDFPEFGNEDNHNNNNDIQIDEEPVNNNFGGNNWNEPRQFGGDGNFMGSTEGNYDWGNSLDPEEQKRVEARRAEEEERRAKLSEKISKELEDKQNLRKKAIEYLQRWEDQRGNNIQKRQEYNRANEEEYLKQRDQEKAGNINPWDKVIQNIQLKEGEHKGLRDVSRMKSVILQRKNDFVNLKMK